MTLAADAQCATHANTAVDVCSRCGRFLCAECVDYLDTTPLCDACLTIVTAPASLRARLSAGLPIVAILGTVAGFLVPGRPGLVLWALSIPTGAVGLALALQELAAIDRKASPVAGRRWALVGKTVGLLELVLALGLGALFALFVAKLRN